MVLRGGVVSWWPGSSVEFSGVCREAFGASREPLFVVSWLSAGGLQWEQFSRPWASAGSVLSLGRTG